MTRRRKGEVIVLYVLRQGRETWEWWWWDGGKVWRNAGEVRDLSSGILQSGEGPVDEMVGSMVGRLVVGW